MNAIQTEANIMIKPSKDCNVFISSFIPTTAWAAPEDCWSCFASSGDPCCYLEGSKGRQTLALESHRFKTSVVVCLTVDRGKEAK